jgi:hypothetical protein
MIREFREAVALTEVRFPPEPEYAKHIMGIVRAALAAQEPGLTQSPAAGGAPPPGPPSFALTPATTRSSAENAPLKELLLQKTLPI